MYLTGGAAQPFPRRPLGPLALTLGLHLLLVLAWFKGAAPGVEREAAGRVSTFVLVQPPPADRPKPVADVPPPRPRVRLPGRAAAPSPAPESAADPVSEPVETAPAGEAPAVAAALPGDLLANSKRMAGSVDRALRNGSSPITAEPERKWERFASALAAAYTGGSRDTLLESYTAGDGVVIYRKTVGNRVACYRSGSVGGLGPADGQSAGKMWSCPAGVSWTRH